MTWKAALIQAAGRVAAKMALGLAIKLGRFANRILERDRKNSWPDEG